MKKLNLFLSTAIGEGNVEYIPFIKKLFRKSKFANKVQIVQDLDESDIVLVIPKHIAESWDDETIMTNEEQFHDIQNSLEKTHVQFSDDVLVASRQLYVVARIEDDELIIQEIIELDGEYGDDYDDYGSFIAEFEEYSLEEVLESLLHNVGVLPQSKIESFQSKSTNLLICSIL